MADESLFLKPWSTGWEPMPANRPRVRRCPACKSVPLWRHMLRCYWLVCTTCGLSTAAFRDMADAAAAWNIGSEETDLVDGDRTLTMDSIDEYVDKAMERKNARQQ